MIWIYLLLIVAILFDLYLAFKCIEFIYCAFIRRQPPLVSSTTKMRKVVIEQIKQTCPVAKNICEIGSGFGGLARMIAKNTNADVYALENMPFSAWVSKVCDKLFCKNNKTIWCDAFKFLDNTDKQFDVAVAFLGPKLTPQMQKYANKIDVFISLDFEIPNLVPIYVIEIPGGYTEYNHKKYPHRLFVYKFLNMN